MFFRSLFRPTFCGLFCRKGPNTPISEMGTALSISSKDKSPPLILAYTNGEPEIQVSASFHLIFELKKTSDRVC